MLQTQSRGTSPLFKTKVSTEQAAAPVHLASPEDASSNLALSLVQAYRETQYLVHLKQADKDVGEDSIVLAVGKPSGPLQALHSKADVACSAFITACNPWSRTLSDAQNAQRMKGLMEVLRARSLRWYPGAGQHPNNGWPAEPSLLVMGLSLAAARVLGASFEQNAFVWSGPDATPQLILLR